MSIHCTLGHAGNWRALGAELADILTLTAFDLPGHGRAEDWDGTTDFQDVCVDRTLAFMGSGPVDVIGHSFGATVALRVAVEHPERIKTLTLIEPVFFAAAKNAAPDALTPHLAEGEPYLEALDAEEWALAARLFNRHWGDGTKWDDFSQDARDYIVRRIHLVAAQSDAMFDDRPRLLAQGRLERADMPVLLVEGSRSPSIVSVINRALAARLPHATRVTIDGAGHMAPVTHAPEVATAIRRHLQMTDKQVDVLFRD